MTNDRVQGVEECEDVIFVPEAFLAEDDSPQEAPHVEVVQLFRPDRSRLSLKKRHACVAFIFVAVTVIVLGLLIKSGGKTLQLSIESPPRSLFDLPSSQPSMSIRYAIEKNVLQRNATFDAMEVTNHCVFALDRITQQDEMKLTVSDSNLFQRYIMVLLAFEFTNSLWPSDMDECNWIGVDCDTDGNVVTLELSE